MDLLDLTLAAPDEFGMDNYVTEEQTSILPSQTVSSPLGDGLTNLGANSTASTDNYFNGSTTNVLQTVNTTAVNGNQYTSDPFGYYSSNFFSQGSTAIQEEVKSIQAVSQNQSEGINAQTSYDTGDNPEIKDNDPQQTESEPHPNEISQEKPDDKTVKVRAVDSKEEPTKAEEGKTISVGINNVVGSFSTRCHINLKKLALEGLNVIYKRENGMVSMKIRNPSTTASVWSSGKITCTGSTSELQAKQAARKVARILQKMGFRVRFCDFRVVNVLGTCSLPFGIKIAAFSREHPKQASYEPELHPGVTFTIKPPKKATLKIFSTGSITVTAPSVANVKDAIEHIFPLVYDHRMDKISKKGEVIEKPTKASFDRHSWHRKAQYGRHYVPQPSQEDLYHDSDGDDFDSEASVD